MFLPLGFGTWPRVFPVAIILLALTCVVWSHQFFPTIEAHRNSLKKNQMADDSDYKILKLTIQRETCNKKFDNSTLCDPKNEFTPPAQDSSVFKPLTDSVEIFNFLQAFQGTPETWPEETKSHPDFQAAVADFKKFELEKKQQAAIDGLTTLENISLLSLLKATFTHAGYMHLIGNLFFLIVFGVWVEQCVGALLACLLFIAGSFCGIGIQLLLVPQSAVLGASAGVTAIMGTFFALFLRSEFQFLFTFGFFYFKRIAMPLLAVFPFFYMLSDISAVMAYQANSGVAHWAHIVGLILGFGFGMLYKYLISFKNHQFFVQEAPFLRTLRKSQDPPELWHAFKNVMDWNCQNWPAVEAFLRKTSVYSISFDDDKDMEFFKKHLSSYLSYIFRSGSTGQMIQAIKLFPTKLALAPYIPNIPISQILHVADQAAKMRMYDVAMPLYLTSLLRLKDENQLDAVKKAVSAIEQFQAAQKPAVGG